MPVESDLPLDKLGGAEGFVSLSYYIVFRYHTKMDSLSLRSGKKILTRSKYTFEAPFMVGQFFDTIE